MGGISYSTKVKEYRKARKNYLERYRYWTKKIGEAFMPERIPVINLKKEKITVKDIAKLQKATAGYFMAQSDYYKKHTQEYDNENYDYDKDLHDKFIREVDYYYNAVMGIPDLFQNEKVRAYVEKAVEAIAFAYSKEQIAYIARKSWESIQSIIDKALLYDNDSGAKKVEDIMFLLYSKFEDARIPYNIDEETWDDYDRDFKNAGDFGEYKEEDMV